MEVVDVFLVIFLIILVILNVNKYLLEKTRDYTPKNYFDILYNLNNNIPPTNIIIGNNITKNILTTSEIKNYRGLATMLPWKGINVPNGWRLYLPLSNKFVVKDSRPIQYILAYIEKI
jgi:hypothetical protein